MISLNMKNGQYFGEILNIHEGLVEQHIGKQSLMHEITRLSFVPERGLKVWVKYKDGFATVEYDSPPDGRGGHNLEIEPGKKKKNVER